MEEIIIQALQEDGPLTLREIAQRSGVDSNQAGSVLDNMVNQGVLQRIIDNDMPGENGIAKVYYYTLSRGQK